MAENWSLILCMSFSIISTESVANRNFTSNSPEWNRASFWSWKVWS